jgi:hypothetical protein
MTARTYRLAAADRTGWLLGLSGAQVLPLGAGLAIAVVVVASTGSATLAFVPFVAGVTIGFVRIGDVRLLEGAPVLVGYLARRRHRRFDATLPFPGPELSLPRAFGRAEFVVAQIGSVPVAVALDQSAGLAAATLMVAAPTSFLLSDEAEQVRFLDNFGDALAPLCQEGGPVVSLRWSSFAAPTGRPPAGWADGPAVPAYREVLDLLAGDTEHEVFLTLTVASGRRRSAGTGLVDLLVGELRLISDRLVGAGLTATPVDADGFGSALRRRLDPTGRGAPDRLATLAATTGLASVAAAGPLCVEERWDRVQIDATVHRAYQVVEWPRSEVPPAWTADLLLALPATRTVCVVFEPVTPRASRRAVERLAAKLDSDEEQRRRAGFRVGAEQEATRGELATRERELVAGYPEFDYAGLVVLSAADVDTLDELEAQARSVAAAAGVELAPFHGRHAATLALCLPLPLTSTRRSR